MRPVLCLVTDRRLCARPLETVVAEAVAAGVDWVQLRERDLPGAALLELARGVLAAARAASRGEDRTVRVLVNRRVDVALAAGADGVHLGFDGMGAADARLLLGPRATIGVATHAAAEVGACAGSGVDYVQLAPIFDPRSKAATRAPLGLACLRAAAAYGLAVLAQGGIDATNAGAVARAGAAGVAVTGAILQAPDPGRAARALREALDGAAEPGIDR